MNKPLPKYGLGWKPNFPDYRDRRFVVSPELLENLPPVVDLRPQSPPIMQQGQIGSCTANALSAAVQFDRLKQGSAPDFVPSRLFIYYNERVIEADVSTDAGARLRTGMQSLASQGVCPEVGWPYVATLPDYEGGPFPVGSPPVTRPPKSCYDEAVKYRIVSYESVEQSLAQLRGTIASGYPFVFGFTLYASWFDQDPLPAIIPLPSGDDSFRGGHAVMVCGYDDSKTLFTIQNSWGTDLGDQGYFYMPYSYLTDVNLTSDFWVIKTTAG